MSTTLKRRLERLEQAAGKGKRTSGSDHELVHVAEIDAFALELQQVGQVVGLGFEVGDLCLEGSELIDGAHDLLLGECSGAGGRIGLSHDCFPQNQFWLERPADCRPRGVRFCVK